MLIKSNEICKNMCYVILGIIYTFRAYISIIVKHQ